MQQGHTVEQILANAINMLNQQGMTGTVEAIVNDKPFTTVIADPNTGKAGIYVDFMNPLVTDQKQYYQMSQQLYQEFNSIPYWHQAGKFEVKK